MDEISQAHTQLFINSSIKQRKVEAIHRAIQFPVDVKGNMVFDNEGWVTRRKKTFKQNTMYYKAMQEFVISSEENLAPVPAYIEESNLERDNRIVLCVKVDILTPLTRIHRYFCQAGQIKSVMISVDEIQRKSSLEIEFYSFKSVAVALALAVMHRKTNICAKTENIHVDSDSFPVEETKISRGGDFQWYPDVLNQRIHIGFSHIPMTVDWLEKIFRVFDVVEKISIPRPPNHGHLGHAILQFQSRNGVHEAIRLSKQLKLSNKNAEVKMEVTACNGTKWLHNGDMCVPPRRDGSVMPF